jgi:hypothetical protein
MVEKVVERNPCSHQPGAASLLPDAPEWTSMGDNKSTEQENSKALIIPPLFAHRHTHLQNGGHEEYFHHAALCRHLLCRLPQPSNLVSAHLELPAQEGTKRAIGNSTREILHVTLCKTLHALAMSPHACILLVFMQSVLTWTGFHYLVLPVLAAFVRRAPAAAAPLERRQRGLPWHAPVMKRVDGHHSTLWPARATK